MPFYIEFEKYGGQSKAEAQLGDLWSPKSSAFSHLPASVKVNADSELCPRPSCSIGCFGSSSSFGSKSLRTMKTFRI